VSFVKVIARQAPFHVERTVAPMYDQRERTFPTTDNGITEGFHGKMKN